MKLLTVLLTGWFTAALLAGAQTAAVDARIQEAVDALAERKMIEAPEYWIEQLTAGGKVEGEKVAALLTAGGRLFKPVASTAEAIAVLEQRGIISSPNYWLKRAVPGGVCDGTNVAAIVTRLGGRLPIAPPKS